MWATQLCRFEAGDCNQVSGALPDMQGVRRTLVPVSAVRPGRAEVHASVARALSRFSSVNVSYVNATSLGETRLSSHHKGRRRVNIIVNIC